MTNPVPNCPQPETPIRERAYTAEQGERPKVELVTMRESNGRVTHLAIIRKGERYMEDGHSSIKGRAEYCVAKWKWLLLGAPEPDILSFDCDPPTPAALAQNAQVEAEWAKDVGNEGGHYLHAERARVPAGMVLVPREPTEAMLEAAAIREDDEPLSDWGKCVPAPHAEIYKAMLAAAPSQPYQWPSFEVVQTWALANGYSGASDNEAYDAYRKAHPSRPEDVE